MALRFINDFDALELIQLYHTARIALSGKEDGRHARMIWASKEFSKKHPEISSIKAYKDLDSLLIF